MKPKILSLIFFVLACRAIAHPANDILDPDRIETYLRASFSSKKFLLLHDKMVSEGYRWDRENCHEGQGGKKGSAYPELEVLYAKVAGKEKSEFVGLTVTFNLSKGGKLEVTRVTRTRAHSGKFEAGIKKSDVEMDLKK